MNNTDITVGKGFGDIHFGMTRDELEKIAGKPTEVDAFEYDEEEKNETESWHYDEIEFSVSFDEIDDWKLGTIAVSSDKFTLHGKTVIGQPKDKVMAILKEMELGDSESDIIQDDEQGKIEMIAFDDSSIMFWFEGDTLSEIQFGPFYDEDGKPKW